jgi:hypothetical protein
MKTLFRKIPVLGILLIGSVVNSPAGGECFEIFQDNKLVLQRCGKDINSVQTISLANAGNSELTVKYYHCGQVGKNRVLTLKSSDGKTLKEWKFANSSTKEYGMKCGVKEIFSTKVSNTANLKLYYSSSELPDGKLLAIINATGTKTTNP